MATLKEHQAAMVDLLANGSGIPASASRLAHAMRDVLQHMTTEQLVQFADWRCQDATTPGLNDKALSKREKAMKTDSPAKWPTPAEQRVKELENTIRQLKANNAKLKAKEPDVMGEIHKWAVDRCLAGRGNYIDVQNVIIDAYIGREPEQAGCRKEDTQCLHTPFKGNDGGTYCADCGAEL